MKLTKVLLAALLGLASAAHSDDAPYKVVDGSPEFMGTLACRFDSKTAALSCTSSNRNKDDWEFHVIGDTMSGRLMIDDGKTLYRRITLRRVPK